LIYQTSKSFHKYELKFSVTNTLEALPSGNRDNKLKTKVK